MKHMNMLHAPDYSQMSLNQLKQKISHHKQRDRSLANSMRFIIYLGYVCNYLYDYKYFHNIASQ